MTDTDRDALTPMTDGDIMPPPAGTRFTPAAPLKGVVLEPEGGTIDDARFDVRQTLKDKTAEFRDQAGGKARAYAEDGKAKATDALGQLSKMLTDAAEQVDEKLGEQYGQYARTAADKVQTFSSSIGDTSLDDLLENARELVRKSPAVAIGAAAAVGFVVARLLTSGLDQRDSDRA